MQFPTQLGVFPASNITPKAWRTFLMGITAEEKELEPETIFSK
ncbi:hypothetical protein AQPE_1335 [Aquipluma nitroreducens]|uniref:Uncharacterized protein n=1 Tax=Aquipluma nitroreducens TaxID=2010828 RepID=A0A5K7S6N4_9BACT|nr:hypothetical protein [Aquipluma nitroreducens]BBE17186.1 hypothetical protein AQPE_1335 [Aquipluma nitroreducens]